MANRKSDNTAALLRDIQNRVQKLERAVFAQRSRGMATAGVDTFKGATGGIRLLVDKGFFDCKRAFGEIKKALADNSYHYSKQAVQTPLNSLSRPGSLLVSFREGGKKVYAKRK